MQRFSKTRGHQVGMLPLAGNTQVILRVKEVFGWECHFLRGVEHWNDQLVSQQLLQVTYLLALFLEVSGIIGRVGKVNPTASRLAVRLEAIQMLDRSLWRG